MITIVDASNVPSSNSEPVTRTVSTWRIFFNDLELLLSLLSIIFVDPFFFVNTCTRLDSPVVASVVLI